MPQEIERKFLVTDESYRRMAHKKSRIEQGYICSARGKTVRIRIRDDKGYITIKGPSNASGTSRYEWEQELCEPGRIEKVRYLVDFSGHTFEVDEFHGENEGLTVAEVELGSEAEAVELPAFIGEVVTGQTKYYNSFLMKQPYTMWE